MKRMISIVFVLCLLDIILLTGLLLNWDCALQSYINRDKIEQNYDLPTPLVYEEMIVDGTAPMVKNDFTAIKNKTADWHKCKVWSAAEQFYHNRKIFEQYIDDKTPSDSVYKEAFLAGIIKMTKLIKATRKAENRYNPKWGWIDSIASQKLGVQSDSIAVIIVRKTDENKKKLFRLSGIALKVEKKYFFFPSCTLEYKPQEGMQITGCRDCYGYWLPTLVNKEDKFLSLTYWGSNEKTENAQE